MEKSIIEGIIDGEIEKLEQGERGTVSREVDVREFIESNEYLGNERHRWVWPVVEEDLTELFSKNEDGSWKYHEAVFDEGIGSGKGTKIAIAATYKTYLMLNKTDPQRYYKKRPGSRFALMNASIKFDQAKDIVFGDITATIELCRWFKKYQMLPDPHIQSRLVFPKDVFILPGSSKDTTAVGYNLYTAIIDEAAWFPVTEGLDGDKAEEIYYSMMRRLKNRFPTEWLLMIISSPRYEDDFIERKYEEAQTDKTIYAQRRPCWRAMPKEYFPKYVTAVQQGQPGVFSYGPYEDIPIDFVDDYRKNPSKAQRDLGAIPSLVLEPFFEEYDRLETNVNRDRINPLPEKVDEKGQQLPESPKEQLARLPESFRGQSGVKYFLHVDLATGGASGTGDRCGFCIGHAKRLEKRGEQLLPIGVIDLMTRFKASPLKEIQISEVQDFIIELNRRSFLLKKITFDGWQSVESIQRLRNLGFREVETLSIQMDAYETMKEMIYDKRLDYYLHEGFLKECKRLERKEGRRVEKSARSSDDLSDSVSGVCKHIAESLLPPDKPRRHRVDPLVGMGLGRKSKFGPPGADRQTYRG